jgi:hypothetical protein
MNGTSETGERSAVARANALAQYPENPTAVMIRPIESLYGQVFAEPTSVMLSVFLAPRVEIAVEKGDLWRQPVKVESRVGDGGIITYTAVLIGKAAPQNEAILWQGGNAPMMGWLPLDVAEWGDDHDLAWWIASCYDAASGDAYALHRQAVRSITTKARAAYEAQNGESAPF